MTNRCEDFPCCGHEAGDCDGSKYGSTASILKTDAMLRRKGYDDYEIDMYWESQR